MSVSKRRVIAGMGIVVVLLLFRVELESQVVSNWVDHWPTARGGVIAVMDTVCWDYDTLDNDPCDSTRLAVVGYIPDTNTVIDSCLWSSRMLPFGGNCSCGGLYPGGVDYAYDTWGWNYDPAHQFDTCGNHDQANPCGGPAQPRHLYDVPCWYETDTTDPNHPKLNTGCFTLQFAVTHCQQGKKVNELEFDFSNFDLSCFGDSVTINDVSVSPSVNVATFEKDSTGTPIGSSKFYIDLSNNKIPPPPPCAPRILSFEVCGLWKEGRSPAEHECAAVFEVTFMNDDISECGKVPFIFGGRCPNIQRIEPVKDGGDNPSLSYRLYYYGE